ncbi:restriction endonuclease subunit S [Microbispora amethystogenes]|uniref:restriction endonuclease subunit S n=1 Tax=Microbispora amethystogenes TaxID=1427754 RepID=UPI0033EB7726
MRELPDGWRWVRLADVASAGGKYGSGEAAIDYDPSLPRYVRITDIEADGRLSREKRASIKAAAAKPYILKKGDLLFARSGATVGKTYLYQDADGVCAHAGYVIKFVIDDSLALPAYVAHWTQGSHYWRWINSTLRQGAQPNINATEYGNHRLPLPTIPEQRRIAEILDTLDSHVALIDLAVEKVRRRSQGLVESLLSNVSAEESPLGKFLMKSPKNGYSPKEVDEWTGFLAIGLGCLTTDGFKPRQLKNIRKSDLRGSAAVLQDGDLLISRANTRDLVGLAGRYQDVGFPCIYPDLLMKLTVNQRCGVDFLELVLRSASSRRQIQAMAQGTSESMVKINGSTVTKLLVRVPDRPEQERILRLTDASKRSIRDEQQQREKLLLLKKGLMEDLLAGRVRVSEAEAVLEEL